MSSPSENPSTPAASTPAATAPQSPLDKLRHFPVEIQDSYKKFEETGDKDALAKVIFAILGDFIPKRPGAQPLGSLPETTRLIDDLGFDSLAITETVFFAEDLFSISITNEEILSVRTVGDLKEFIIKKLADKKAA